MSKSRLALYSAVVFVAACGSSSTGTTNGTGGNGGAASAGQSGAAGSSTGGSSTGGSSSGGSTGVTPTGGSTGVTPTGGSTGVTPTGGAGGGSAVPPIVNNVSRVDSIAVDDTYLYYFTEIATDIMRAPKDGTGTPASIFASTRQPIAIVADASGIYWTEDGSDTTDGAVRSCPPTGCPAAPATLASHEPKPSLIAIDGTLVYWNNANYYINSTKKDGTVGGGTIFHASSSAVTSFYSIGGLAVDPTSVYFTSAGLAGAMGGTWICPVAGCGTAAPTSIGAPAGKIALDATHIFSIGSASGVLQALKNGTSPVVINPTLAGTAVATDGVNVYWADGTAINKCAVGGCTSATPVATIASPARTIVLDAGYVYWAEWGVAYPPAPGVIRRAAK